MLSLIGKISRNVLGSNILRVPRRSIGNIVDDDGELSNYRTTVSIVNQEVGMFVDSYSTSGFKLSNGIGIIGPCAIFSRSILHWNVGGVQDINEDSIRLFTMLDPKLELLVLGVGEYENLQKLNPELKKYLIQKKLNFEILSTDQAVATFNFLNSENRYIAGAFIPPTFIKSSHDEDILHFRKKREEV